jgi:hypothetical protein
MDWAEIIGHMRSYLLKKNYTSNAFYEQMIKTYRSKIVTVVLCGCEICPYIRKNRQIVDVWDEILRVFGPKRQQVTARW